MKLPSCYQYSEVRPDTFYVSLRTIDDINEWMQKYSEHTGTNWSIKKTIGVTSRFVCRKVYVCHHSGYKRVLAEQNDKGKSKNSGCMATIDITLKLVTKSTKKNNSLIKSGLHTIIKLNTQHNHSLESAEALRFLRPTQDTRKLFVGYFNDGLTVAEAMQLHESKLELEIESNSTTMANAAVNPTYRTVSYWYDMWRQTNMGPRFGSGILQVIKLKESVYKENGVIVKFQEEPFAIVIMTQIMQRAHNLPLVKDIVFVDSTASCDADSHSVTFMLTPCHIGAVPLAVIITRGQSVADYSAGFSLMMSSLDAPFCGEGYPKIFITDDSEAEREGLKASFPLSQLLLCRFHVMQALWRWLWERKHEVEKDHRPVLYKLFQNILVSSTKEMAREAFLAAVGENGSSLPLSYPQWIKHVKKYWDRREIWCLAWRDESTHGHQTNNLSEVTIRIFKDLVLSRNKAYNPVALVDYVITGMEQYYSRRLRNFANSRCPRSRLMLQSQMLKASYISKNDIQVISSNIYRVPSESQRNEFYDVDTFTGVCTCDYGRLGRFCKHQASVYKHFDECLPNLPAVTAKTRYEMARLAYGNNVHPLSFYEELIPSEGKDASSNLTHPQQQSTVEQTASFQVENVEDAHEQHADKQDLGMDECTLGDGTSEVSQAKVASPIHHLRSALCQIRKQELGEECTTGTSVSTDDDHFLNSLQIMLIKYTKFGISRALQLKKFMKRLQKVNTDTAWKSFLATAGGTIAANYHPGANIRVQPTSISRRKPGVTRGAKKLPVGRPATNSRVIAKRKRSLSLNVKCNQPNAKSHGSGH